MKKHRGTIVFIFSIYLYLGLYISMLQRTIGEVGAKYGLDHTSIGLVIMTAFIGYFIAPILTGELTDRFGRRAVLLTSFITMTVGIIVVLLIDHPVGVAVGLLVVGMAFGMMELSTSSILTDIRPDSANKILGRSRLFTALGTISGPFIAMALLGAAGDWLVIMYCMGGLLIVLFAVFMFLSYPKSSYPNYTVHAQDKPYTTTLLRNKIVILLAMSLIMYSAVESGVTFLATRYIGSLTPDPLYASIALSVFWAGVAVGRLVSSMYRKGLHALVAALSVIAIAGVVVAMLSYEMAGTLVAFGVLGLGCSGIFPTVLAQGKLRFPKTSGTVFGILISSAALGGIAISLIMGAVADSAGLRVALGTCFIPLAVIIVVQLILHRIPKRKQNDIEEPKDPQ